MALFKPASPSTMGVRPSMQKVYDGRNVATRPIPIIVDSSEARAIAAAAADAKPKAESVNWNMSGTAASNGPVAAAVFGVQVASGGDVMRTGVFNPATGTDNFE